MVPADCSHHSLAGTYFNFIQGMVAASVVLTVLVLNYHHRNPDTHNMPTWVTGSSHTREITKGLTNTVAGCLGTYLLYDKGAQSALSTPETRLSI